MKKILALVVLSAFLAMSGCTSGTSVGCTIQGGVDSVLAPVIANGLQCTNQAAIEASLQAAGAKAGLCTSTTTQSLSATSALCQALADGLVALVGSAIPSAWACTPTSATATLTTLVNGACAALGQPAPAPSATPAAAAK
jgi:hypothetical protein